MARAADVAPSTVSLVTNGTGYVSEDKRRVIEEVVRRVGYRPRGRQKSRASDALAARPPETAASRALDVAVLYVPVPGRGGLLTATILAALEGVNAALAERQVRPSLIAAADHIEDDVVMLNHLRSRQMDGAILMGLGGSSGHGYLEHLREAGVPVVFAGHRAMAQGVSSVNADFYHGSVVAIEHLRGLGHERIGFLGLAADHWPTAERRRGYEQTLRAQGLPVDEPLYTQSAEPAQQRAMMAAHLRASVERGCTAFVAGDFNAQVAVPILEELGHDVPESVSVVGFDDLGLTVGRRSLRLTSIGYDKTFLGVTAVKTLFEIIESGGRLAAADKTINVTLHAGATTTAARIS